METDVIKQEFQENVIEVDEDDHGDDMEIKSECGVVDHFDLHNLISQSKENEALPPAQSERSKSREYGGRKEGSPRRRSRSRTKDRYSSKEQKHSRTRSRSREDWRYRSWSREHRRYDRQRSRSRESQSSRRKRSHSRDRQSYSRYSSSRDHRDRSGERRYDKRRRSDSQESSSRYVRASSRVSTTSIESSSRSSFKEIAENILAGSIENHSAHFHQSQLFPTKAQQPSTFGKPLPQSVFGKPPPLQQSKSEFDRMRESLELKSSKQSNLTLDINPLLETRRANMESMTARVEAALSVRDQIPSSIFHLDRIMSTSDLLHLYHSICPTPCPHSQCSKTKVGSLDSCVFAPKVNNVSVGFGETQLVFTNETRAALFMKLLNMHGIYGTYIPSMRRLPDLSLFTLTSMSEKRVGIPQVRIQETFLFCTVAMELISSASVEEGRVSAPVKISFFTGMECVTKPVVPLQFTKTYQTLADRIGLSVQGSALFIGGKFILDTDICHERFFLEEVFSVLMRLLKQNSHSNAYDKAVLMFKSWEEAEVFIDWVKLTEYRDKFKSYVSLIGITPMADSTPLSKLYKQFSGWKMPDECFGVQEESVACHAIITGNIQKPSDLSRSTKTLMTLVYKDCITIDDAFDAKYPLAKSQVGDVCMVSLEYVENSGEYEISQIGACLILSGTPNKKLFFSPVLPRSASQDPLLFSDLGMSTNALTNKTEYLHLGQKVSYDVVSELQSLLSLFDFINTNKKCSKCLFFSYASYTTLPVLLQAVERHGLERQFYEIFTSYSDLQGLLMAMQPENEYFQHGVPPLAEIAKDLVEMTVANNLPANGCASVLYNLVEKIVYKKKQKLAQFLSRCSKSTAGLHFKDAFMMPMYPLKDEFIWPQEQKLVEFKIESENPEVDFSRLLFILHSQVLTGSDKLAIISNTISHQGVTAIIQNLSTNPFLLNPDSILGHLILTPETLFIPRALPSLDIKINQKHSSAEGLFSKRQACLLNYNREGANKSNPELGSSEPTGSLSQGIDYAGTTNLTNFIRSTSKETHVVRGCDNFPNEDKKFDVLVLSLRCLKQKKASKNLIPIQILLKSLVVRNPTRNIHILPWDSKKFPSDNLQCTTCKTTFGLHFPDSCPTKQNCTCSPDFDFHSRLDCENESICWNCRGSHNWGLCPWPLLTDQQQELKKLGYCFATIAEKARITFKGNDGVEFECYSKAEAMKMLIQFLFPDGESDFEGNYLVGYNMFMMLAVIVDMAESSGRNDLAEIMFSGLRGILDLKWLFPTALEEKSMEALCGNLGLKTLQKKFLSQRAELKFVEQGVTEILRRELNLSKYKDIAYLCKNFALQVNQSDLRTLSRKRIIPSKTFFKKFRSINDIENVVETAKKDEEEEDTDLLKNYTKSIKKHQFYQVHPMEEKHPNKCNAYILSIKTFELGDRKYLNSLSLVDMNGSTKLSCETIIPREYYTNIPEQDTRHWCQICRYVGAPKSLQPIILHSTKDCPTSGKCTIHHDGVPEHTKQDCTENKCWNCGEAHNWRKCPDPILTETQHFFSTIGYRPSTRVFQGERCFTFSREVGNLEEKVDCIREDRVYERLLKVLESSSGSGKGQKENVLVGFNIGEQLHDLFECCEKATAIRDELTNSIHAMVDLKWLPQFQGKSMSLQTIATGLLREVTLGETMAIAKCVASLIRLDKSNMIWRICLPFSKPLVKILNTKNVLMQEMSNQAKSHEDPKSIVATYAYLETSEQKDAALNVKLDMMVWNFVKDKSIFEDTFTFTNSGESQSDIAETAMRKLLNAFDLCEKGSHINIVTVCPESLGIFQEIFEKYTKMSFFKVFDGWTSLATEAYSLHLPSMQTAFHSIQMQKSKLCRLHSFFNSDENKVSEESLSSPAKMMDIHHCLIRKWKTKVEEQKRIEGSVQHFPGFSGRELRIMDVKDCVYVFFHITVDEKLFDEYNSPVVKKITFKDISGTIQNTQKPESFLTMCRNLFINRKIIYIAFDDKSLVPLLGLGFWVPEVFSDSVAGVSTIEEFLVARKPEFKNNPGNYYQSVSSDDNFDLSRLGPSERVLFMQKVFLHLQMVSAPREILASTVHRLDSPFVNKVFLNSGLDILSEDVVWIKLQTTLQRGMVCETKPTLKPGSNILAGKITKCLWNYDREKISLKVNIFASCCDKSVRFPEQICPVLEDSKISVAAMNFTGKPVKKAKLGSAGYLLGFIKYVSEDGLGQDNVDIVGDKSEFEEYYDNRFGKGFTGFESEYTQYKRRNNQLVSSSQCQEYIQCFKILGFTSMKQVFHQVISSCKNTTNSTEELFKHLQALLCNDFPNQGEMANILFSSLYAQFVLKHEEKEKFPAFEELDSDRFCKEGWIFKVEIDGVLLERMFHYKLKSPEEYKADLQFETVNREVIESDDNQPKIIEIKEEPEDDDIEIVEAVSENYWPGNSDDSEKNEEGLHELDILPEPVACSSLDN